MGKFQTVAPIVPMADPTYYRFKVQAVFGYDKRGHVVSGIYRRGTHVLIPVRSCFLEDKGCDAILATIRRLARTLEIPIYEEDQQTGFLRHVLIRKGRATGQTMVVLVCGSTRFPKRKEFVGNLVARHPEIVSVLLNKNDEQTSMVLSDAPETLLWGKPFIEDELLGVRFRISPKSFFQVNPLQAETLYKIAVRMARLTGKEKVLDAYCGIGAIGLIAAKNGAAQVLGVETSPEAVEDARANAKANGIANAAFVCADASDFLKDLSKRINMLRSDPNCALSSGPELFAPDVVFLDPPRSGSSERFLASLVRLAPRTIVYISCCVETLERDLRYIFSNSSYIVEGIQPVDMFPHTEHIETVVLLSRKDA